MYYSYCASLNYICALLLSKHKLLILMEIISDLIKIVFPAALVLTGIYMSISKYLQKDFEKKILELRTQNSNTIAPIRLQAYERIALLLERITPHNLILRVNDPAFTVLDLQTKLLMEVREEFNHNLSQQIYMSDEAWALVRKAVQDIISVINTSAQQVAKDAPGIELARKVFEQMIDLNEEPTALALRTIKDEIRQIF